jgi:hypothetical protein
MLGIQLKQYTMGNNIVKTLNIPLDSIMESVGKRVHVLWKNGDWNIVIVDEKEEPQTSTHSNASSSSLGYVIQWEPSLQHSSQWQQPSLQYIAPSHLQYKEPWQTNFLYSSQRPPFLSNQRPSLQYIAPWHPHYREPSQTSFLYSSQRAPFLGNQRPSLQYIAPSDIIHFYQVSILYLHFHT